MRAVRTVSVHIEYLDNRSRGLDVTWQPVRGDLPAHLWTVTPPVGLVSRQWDAVDWACVLCDRRIHSDPASRLASSRHCACPFYSFRAGFSGKASHHPGLSAPLQPRFAPRDFWLFPNRCTFHPHLHLAVLLQSLLRSCTNVYRTTTHPHYCTHIRSACTMQCGTRTSSRPSTPCYK